VRALSSGDSMCHIVGAIPPTSGLGRPTLLESPSPALDPSASSVLVPVVPSP
jgi:hypothetical protein